MEAAESAGADLLRWMEAPEARVSALVASSAALAEVLSVLMIVAGLPEVKE